MTLYWFLVNAEEVVLVRDNFTRAPEGWTERGGNSAARACRTTSRVAMYCL